MPTDNKKTYCFRLPLDLIDRLRNIAEQEGEAAAVIARRGILKEVRKLEKEHAKLAAARKVGRKNSKVSV